MWLCNYESVRFVIYQNFISAINRESLESSTTKHRQPLELLLRFIIVCDLWNSINFHCSSLSQVHVRQFDTFFFISNNFSFATASIESQNQNKLWYCAKHFDVCARCFSSLLCSAICEWKTKACFNVELPVDGLSSTSCFYTRFRVRKHRDLNTRQSWTNFNFNNKNICHIFCSPQAVLTSLKKRNYELL